MILDFCKILHNQSNQSESRIQRFFFYFGQKMHATYLRMMQKNLEIRYLQSSNSLPFKIVDISSSFMFASNWPHILYRTSEALTIRTYSESGTPEGGWPGGPCTPSQFLAHQLTLFQPRGGQIMSASVLLPPPNFWTLPRLAIFSAKFSLLEDQV